MTPPALIVLFCAAAARRPPNTLSPEESFAEALPQEPRTKGDQ